MDVIRTHRYRKDLARMGVSESEQAALELAIVTNPEVGDVIPGLRGLRKIRFSLRNKGKRGGGRAIYYLMFANDAVVMLAAYAKNERDDMSPDQKRAILSLLKELKNG